MQKFLFVLVLLILLFPAINVFGAACAGNCATKCPGKGAASCASFYSMPPSLTGKLCYWGGANCIGDIKCSAKCTMGAKCTAGARKVTAKCTAIGNSAACKTHYQTTGVDKFCRWTTALGNCKVAGACVPEFFGIEFGEMQLSTGIIALIAAVGLPLFLFKRKKVET